MYLKHKYLLIALLFLLVFTACSPQQPKTASPTTPTRTETLTQVPTKPVAAATATILPPTEGPAAQLGTIQMFENEAGWAWTMDGRVLHTTDGGMTWFDRTPGGFQYLSPGFYLDAQIGWLTVYLGDSNRNGLLYTSDGGQSWVEYPQGPASGLHFADALNGWAVSGDVGAGNVYFTLFQTSDGGKTWAPIPVKPQEPEPGLPLGTIHLCNLCNDAFYYDPGRMVIVYGDMGTMQPGGSVSLEVSFDLGSTWQKQNLPLPEKETDALVNPHPPIFFTDRDGILPIHLLKMNPDYSYGEQRMVFYATSDGGASWTLLPGVLDAVPLFKSIQVDASQDIFAICGNTLCTSQDKARTWQTVNSDLDFTTSDTRAVNALDFINSRTGWVSIMENENARLYKTTDGGTHWSEIAPRLAAASPPTVIVDENIPTPTTIPTATLEPTPTPNVVYDPQTNADRITFAPYATWAEINSNVTAGEEKRFVLSAMQYQTMSVSVSQGILATVKVEGADKETLSDDQNPRFYWRGVLPSTQDYYVTVISQVDGPITLRIAINPPGLANQYFEYVDPQYHAVLDYSDEFAPINWQLPFTTKGTPLLNLYFIEPSYYYPTTNLEEAALVLTASSDPSVVSTCTQPAQAGESVSGQVTVNGYTFTRSEFVGAAAGNMYDQVFYRSALKGQCFEVIFLIHSADIGNYPAGKVIEYDRERLMHKFEEVLGTFVVK